MGTAFSLSSKRDPWFLILLSIAVVLSFMPILSNGLLLWDDGRILTNNFHYRGFSFSQIEWMFTTFYSGHYMPLTWISFAIDYLLWGMNPLGYHLSNLFLHILNSILFYFLIKAFLSRQSAFAPQAQGFNLSLCALLGALFFALHPLRVESVAWATERRDVLSAFFYLLTLHSYLLFIRATATSARKWYLLSISCFLCSLLSKAWGITLPIMLLVLDVYPLRRTSGLNLRATWGRLLTEKLPYFLLALLFGLLAFTAQNKYAMQMVTDHGLFDRTVQASFGLCFYPFKTIFPVGLSPLYLLRYDFNPFELRYLLCPPAVAGLTFWLWKQRHRWPWALAAWLCYGIIVSPVLGIAQSGQQIAADRYTYLACLPLALLLSAGLLRLSTRSPSRRRATDQWPAALILTGLALCTLSFLSFRQSRIWYDDIALWNHAIALDPGNYVAYNNRGYQHQGFGKTDAALEDYNTAIRLNPKYESAINNRGNIFQNKGDIKAAMRDYDTTLLINPLHPLAHYNRGLILQNQGRVKEAFREYHITSKLRPGYHLTYNNRAILFGREGNYPAALKDFRTALMLNPEEAIVYNNRAYLREQFGDYDEALKDYARAIALDATNPRFFNNRALLRQRQGDRAGTLEDFTALIRLTPKNSNAYFNRALTRQKLGRTALALEDFNAAIRFKPDYAEAWGGRGLLRRQNSDFAGAVSDLNKALQYNPRDITAYINRAELALHFGKPAQAQSDLLKALQYVPKNYPHRPHLQKLLQKAQVRLGRLPSKQAPK